MSKGSQVSHEIIGTGIERYVFKFKDKSGRNAVKIENQNEEPMKLQKIEIQKIPGESNKILVVLIKAL